VSDESLDDIEACVEVGSLTDSERGDHVGETADGETVASSCRACCKQF
jgi:hypothetical protein